MEKQAFVIKMGGNKEMSNALALAAVSPEIARLTKENRVLRVQNNNLRHKYYSQKIRELEASMARARKKRPWC